MNNDFKNHLEPAFPTIRAIDANHEIDDDKARYTQQIYSAGGLTKREYVATQIIQSLIAKKDYGQAWYAVSEAIETADELLFQLAKTEAVLRDSI